MLYHLCTRGSLHRRGALLAAEVTFSGFALRGAIRAETDEPIEQIATGGCIHTTATEATRQLAFWGCVAWQRDRGTLFPQRRSAAGRRGEMRGATAAAREPGSTGAAGPYGRQEVR